MRQGTIQGTEITVETEEGILESVEEIKRVYKTYNLKYKRVMQADSKDIEEWLKPFLHEVTFLERGRKHGSFEVLFKTVGQAMKRSTVIIKKKRLASPSPIHGEENFKN